MDHSPNTIGPFDPFDSAPVAHEPELLELLLRDAKQAPALYRATRYWTNLLSGKGSVLTHERMASLRSDFEILSGFGHSGPIRPARPVAPWKRAIWSAAESLPLVSGIIAQYKGAIDSQFANGRRGSNGRALLALDQIAAAHPHLSIPQGVRSGAPLDLVKWRDRYVPAEFVDYLMRVSDFYKEVAPREVRSVIEIGPGLGWTTVAHIALNPHLDYFANVDIPYTSYVSTQFLKSIGGLDVVDYRRTAGLETIEPRRAARGVVVYQLAPWQVPKLRGSFGLLANAFSFYEMELEVCENYARVLAPLIEKAVLLHSAITGKALDHGPNKAISLDFLCGLFADRFPHRRNLDRGWNEVFGRVSTGVALLTR
jgi:putative sugar O-methyltransferase